jgi:S-adenosylmethionine synthetase
MRDIIRETIHGAGYDKEEWGFDARTVGVVVSIDKQSPDIAQGVDSGGAGDQGMMFGYACDETPELMPAPIQLAHQLARQLATVRKKGVLPYLGPDGKSQVTIEYVDGEPRRADTIVLSAHHTEEASLEQIRDDLRETVIDVVVPAKMVDARTTIHVNPTGRFVLGGPRADAGLTGRKIIVDSYGGYARHGGGCFSGKDPSKVDRSGAYAARYVAKNVVAAGLADRCELQVAYAIGVARPVSVMVECFGTEKVGRGRILELIDEHFDLRPGAFREELRLHRPIYQKTAAYGHFGREDHDFTWERTDKAQALREAAGLGAAAVA